MLLQLCGFENLDSRRYEINVISGAVSSSNIRRTPGFGGFTRFRNGHFVVFKITIPRVQSYCDPAGHKVTPTVYVVYLCHPESPSAYYTISYIYFQYPYILFIN